MKRKRNYLYKEIQQNGNYHQIFLKHLKNYNIIKEKHLNIYYQMKLNKFKKQKKCLHLLITNL